MEYLTLGTGSEGNSHLVRYKETKLLIDCGFSGIETKRRLESRGIKVEDIDYILLTHEHLDHTRGVGVLSRRYGIPVISNDGTLNKIYKDILKEKTDNLRTFRTGEDFELGEIGVKTFKTYHDAVDPVGFSFFAKGKKISILTDTGLCCPKLESEIEDSDILFLEANHDSEMLQGGLYPPHLKRRIASDLGHLSNLEAVRVLQKFIKENGEKIVLGHISKNNNTFEILEKFLDENIRDRFDEKNFEICLSEQDKASRIFK